MIKAAILYGDSVTLNSISSSYFAWHNDCYSQLDHLDSYDGLMLLKRLGETMPDDSPLNQSMIQLLQMKEETERAQGIPFREFVNDLMTKIMPNFKEDIIREAEKERRLNCFNQILKLQEKGMVSIVPIDFENKSNEFAEYFSQSTQNPGLQNFLGCLFNQLEEGTSFPFLDNQIAGIVQQSILEKRIIPGSASEEKNRQMGLVAKVFQKVPLFDQASVDQICDIRSDLEQYLARFRSTISEYSETISSAQWSKDFEHEVNQVFIQKVEPAILDIEEQVKSNSYLKRLTSRFAKKPVAFQLPILTFGVGQHFDFNSIVTVLSSLAPTLVNIADLYIEYKSESQKIMKNNLFFIYELERKVANL